MKLFWIVVVSGCLVGLVTYSLGYKQGLKGSPEYADALASKAAFEADARIARLEAMALAPPAFEECVPIVNLSDLDEYSFCEELLSDREIREHDAGPQDQPERLPRY